MIRPAARILVRVLLVPTFVIAIAMLIKGYASVGDGFSAGVIAASGVLVQYVALGYGEAERLPLVRFAFRTAIVGLLLALLVAFVPVLLGMPVLTHFPRPGQPVIYLGSLELHTAMLYDLAVFCVVFGFTVETIRIIAQLEREETA